MAARPAMSPLSSWSECAATLIDVAMGRRAGRPGDPRRRWVNVHSGEIIPGSDFAIAAGGSRVGAGRSAMHRAETTRVIDADGRSSSRASATGTCTSRAAC